MSARYLLVCAAFAALTACARGPDEPAPAARSSGSGEQHGTQLSALVESYFEDYLRLHPVAATFIGDHRYDDRLPPADYRAQAQALERRYLDEVRRIDRAGLAPAEALDHEVFEYARRIGLEHFEHPAHLLPLDQFNNAAAFFAQMGSGDTVQPFDTVKDYENFAERMRQFPAWADRAIADMREGMRRGVVQPRIIVERLIPQLAALSATSVEGSIFWRPVANMPASFAAAERARLTGLYRQRINESVLPAYQRLHAFCRNEYLAAARPTVGLSALPDGSRWYAYLARAYTTTDTSVEEIHQAGLREVARIDAEVAKLMTRVGFKGSVSELAESMRSDRRFQFGTPGELLDAYRAQMTRAMATTPQLFTLMPQAALDIRPTETFREQSSASAEYYAPTPDGSRPGIFYVNTYDLPARPSYEVETIFLHEAIPGHHFQVALTVENGNLPRYRRFGSDDAFSTAPDITTAYAEGWGLYAESLGDEMGFYVDPYQKLGNLFAEAWRAVRLVVDTGLHVRGWTREQAIDYLMAHTASSLTDATTEIERYIAWPGQALAYKTGQMTIRRLRERATGEIGARFDVREFHAQVLGDGPLPLSVLEAKIERWISASARQAPPAP